VSVHIFLSYSHKSRRLAGELKEGLESFGFAVFLAHEDLKPSVPWRREILRNLRQCDVFIPILTRGFMESEWTDQETGIALALKKKIIALKVHENPYGFIGAFQALKWNKASPDAICWEITECLHEESRFAQGVKDGVIEVFLSGTDFDEVASTVKKLLRFRPFSAKQLHRIIEGSTSNHGIYGCHAARTPMKTLLEDANGKVSRRTIRKYQQAVKSWRY
jgi:TIR domain